MFDFRGITLAQVLSTQPSYLLMTAPSDHVFPGISGLAPGGNLSGLELGSMVGGVKDGGGQQSRFKWMMEGHSPAPSPPDTAHHKNGESLKSSFLLMT